MAAGPGSIARLLATGAPSDVQRVRVDDADVQFATSMEAALPKDVDMAIQAAQFANGQKLNDEQQAWVEEQYRIATGLTRHYYRGRSLNELTENQAVNDARARARMTLVRQLIERAPRYTLTVEIYRDGINRRERYLYSDWDTCGSALRAFESQPGFGTGRCE
jgi:hypothetical protein